MKLTVRLLNQANGHPSGAVPLLCDEHGEPLPNQRCVTIKTMFDDCSIVTVEFVADGDRIRLLGDS